MPHDGIRNGSSTWVSVHDGDEWPQDWTIEPASEPLTYKIRTCGHAPSKQPAGWGLSAFHFSKTDGIRNGSSTWVNVHEGSEWPQDWYFEAGEQPNTYKIRTTGSEKAKQPAGWGLGAFRVSKDDGIRNSMSTWVSVHSGDKWPHDWVLVPV